MDRESVTFKHMSETALLVRSGPDQIETLSTALMIRLPSSTHL